MTKEIGVAYPHPLYLVKVVTGLAILAAIVLTAFWLPEAELPPRQERLLLTLLLLLAVSLLPVVHLIYQRMDELQKLMHKRASMNALVIAAASTLIAGILQINQLIPLFNQFWNFAFIVAVWGLSLMLGDRRYR